MQKRIFAILLVAAVVAMLSPAVQAKAFYVNRDRGVNQGYGTHVVFDENVAGVLLGSTTNAFKFEIDFKYPTALGSTYCGQAGTPATDRYAVRRDGILTHYGLGASATIPNTRVKAVALTGAWAGLNNTTTTYVDGSKSNVNVTLGNHSYIDQATFSGLCGLLKMDNRPYYTQADITGGDDPSGNPIPASETAPTSVRARLLVYRPLADGSAMTSRTLGPDVSAHDNYVNNAVAFPYDHEWHTMRIQIEDTTPSPTASLAIDGTVLISAPLTTPESMVLRSYAEMQTALGTASATYYVNRWNTGRMFVIRSSYDNGGGVINGGDVDIAGSLRWDNIMINDKSLEQFSLAITAYGSGRNGDSLCNFVTRPTGFAPSYERSYNGFQNLDQTENSPFERILGARDWTIY